MSIRPNRHTYLLLNAQNEEALYGPIEETGL
jgi:hypothetical protein